MLAPAIAAGESHLLRPMARPTSQPSRMAAQADWMPVMPLNTPTTNAQPTATAEPIAITELRPGGAGVGGPGSGGGIYAMAIP
jgi:hypothetical protein